jgi:outer membrane protein assembly factor BamB
MGNSGSSDTVFCLSATNGAVIWKYSYRCPGGEYPGPRATPTVSGGRVYTLSREGQAYCFDAGTGKPLWTRDLQKSLKALPPEWGFASSPFVEGNLVIYNVGSYGVALNKANGKTVWQTGSGKAGYASPVSFSAGGRRAVAMFTAAGLVAVNLSNGKKLWSYPWKTQYDANVADPIMAGNKLFISSGYNHGGALLQASATRAATIWQSREMRNHFTTCVLYGGYLYGPDEGTLKCIRFTDGRRMWAKGGIGKGGLIIADGKLIIMSERGDLVIAKAQPTGYEELKRISVLRGTCWTAPSLANGKIYCRNEKGDVACVTLK